MQRELRRCHDHLVSIGTGMSLFGIWTVVRVIMNVILERQQFFEEIQASESEIPMDTRMLMAITLIIIAVLCLMILGIHLYIGMSARAEGLGSKKRTGYLIATGVFILLYGVGIVSEILQYQTCFQGITDAAATVFIDMTMLVTLIELMYNAVRARKITAQLAEQG